MREGKQTDRHLNSFDGLNHMPPPALHAGRETYSVTAVVLLFHLAVEDWNLDESVAPLDVAWPLQWSRHQLFAFACECLCVP